MMAWDCTVRDYSATILLHFVAITKDSKLALGIDIS